MLFHLFKYLEKHFELSGASLFQYITFRAAIAAILSLMISIWFGKHIINFLKRKQLGESVRDLGLKGQKEKEGTPTMGGVMIILAILVPTLLLAELTNIYIILMLLSTVWMGMIGFTDDYLKLKHKNKEGLSGKFKILGQVVLGLIVGLVMFLHEDVVVRLTPEQAVAGQYEIIDVVVDQKDGETYNYVKTTLTNVPFLKGNEYDYASILNFLGENSRGLVWLIFIPFIILVVTATSNAANLTDGIDGLAAGTSAIIGAVLAIFAYVSGNTIFAEYLNILYIPYSGELVIFCAAFFGACIGFLWHNAHPAQVFMGDTGSLALGGIVAALAIVLRKELLIPILCGIFVAENLSVMLQVGYFKYTKKKYGAGRRIFLMSPLHHHYQKKGIHESKIVTRFWIIGIILAVLTLVTLKIR